MFKPIQKQQDSAHKKAMTQPDTHDHPGGAAQPTVSELPDNAAELTSAVYNVGDRFLTDDDERQAIGMDLEEAKLLVSEQEADDFKSKSGLGHNLST